MTAPHDSVRSKASAFTGVLQDARYGIRLLRRQPGFAAIAILTMALGIGATTILFSVAYGVLLKPLPWHDADRLVRVVETRQGRGGRVAGTVFNGSFLGWADHPQTIEGIGGWMEQTATLTGAGDSVRIAINPTTPSLFPLLEVHPLIGRLFRDGEGARGQPGLIILSYGLWQERFGGRVEMIGQVVQLDDKPYTIVGVMPRDFAFPDHQSRAWIAWSVPQVLGEGGVQVGVIFRALARLRAGATLAQASAEATSRARAAASGRGIVGVALFGVKGPIDLSAVPELQAIDRRCPAGDSRAAGRRRSSADDGHRQRRQRAARADDDAAARNGGAHSDRRRAAAHRQAIADRERNCRPVGRRRRRGPRGGTPVDAASAAACGFSASRCRGTRSARARVCVRGVDCREHRLRSSAGLAHSARQSVGGAVGRR